MYPLLWRDAITIVESATAPNASIVWYPCEIPFENTLSTKVFGLISPNGVTTPFIIKTANAIKSAGVNTLPIISTTLEGLIVSNNTIAKNIIENITGDIEFPTIGWTPISNVVAAVLGIANNGPRHIIMATPIILANVLPDLSNILLTSPPHLAAAAIANNANPTSANINPEKPVIQLSPDITPKNGGNIRFPAPKNIANSANPTTIISLFVLFILKPLKVFLFIKYSEYIILHIFLTVNNFNNICNILNI